MYNRLKLFAKDLFDFIKYKPLRRRRQTDHNNEMSVNNIM